ncbi:MAG: dienelactone hydrolase family protein [Deltaproteobacteria bacterium]
MAPTKGSIEIQLSSVTLEGDLHIPEGAKAIVIFAHGSGSSRLSPRNQFVAEVLKGAGLGTLLFDLLTKEEDQTYSNRFDIPLLTRRLIETTQWLLKNERVVGMKFGYFGASTGAASALEAEVRLNGLISAVVSRGGRPDLAHKFLDKVKAPTLFIVGGNDRAVIDLNKKAFEKLRCEKDLVIVPGASHLFEEAGTLEQVAEKAKEWFLRFLSAA